MINVPNCSQSATFVLARASQSQTHLAARFKEAQCALRVALRLERNVLQSERDVGPARSSRSAMFN